MRRSAADSARPRHGQPSPGPAGVNRPARPRRVSKYGRPDRCRTADVAGMNADECAQTRNELGVYLLGAIEPHDRARLEDHLASCPGCRERLAALAGMPALLRKVPADEVIRAWRDDAGRPPPTPPLETLLSKVARTRRRRRWAIAA